jgi:hypothetical protein
MNVKETFFAKVLLRPAEAFAAIAAGRIGWPLPLGLYVLSTAASLLLFLALPAAFIAEAFEGLTFTPGRGFPFYFAVAMTGGLLFLLFISAAISALARFLGEGRLSLRLIAAGLAALAFAVTAGAMHGASGLTRAFGTAAALLAVLAAAWAARSDGDRFPAVFKSMLAISALALACTVAAAPAALAGSAKAYTAIELFFSVLSLYWLAKAVNAIYGAAKARAAAAVVLGLCCGLALLYLVFNLGLITEEVFHALMLA